LSGSLPHLITVKHNSRLEIENGHRIPERFLRQNQGTAKPVKRIPTKKPPC
jgi:hypothetical protein